MNSDLGTAAAREWSDPAKAPHGDAARVFAVRVRTGDGRVTEAIDIREPVGLEIEYEVLKGGYKFLPHYHLFNEEGVQIISIHDVDPEWRRPRPPGRYVSTAWIPGNMLSEGMVLVSAALIVIEPFMPQFYERNVVAFQVIDSMEGDTARGDWAGPMHGAVRPMLKWTTQYTPIEPQPVSYQADDAIRGG